MALDPGTNLGPYTIVGPLGAGGMGEVYRARDSKLGRDVAIKVLPERLAADASALARFETEARAVAALSHPNILAIFDFGTHQTTAYAVMELLEGATLAERLRSGGPLPVRKVVEYGAQIARGLAAAHDKGIVHRDLKPANIVVTGDGHVKLLDFGLARRLQTAADDRAETVATPTEPGTVLGTLGYMAPEQVRGEPVDSRADIFSLGAVLHEMLTGRAAFERGTLGETLAAILRDDPPSLEGGSIPPGLIRIVQHCLEKHTRERFQSARDVAFGLEALSDQRTISASHLEPRPRRRRSVPWPAAALGLGAIGLAAGWLLSQRPSRDTPPTFRQLTYRQGHVTSARFIPDGQTVVYGAMWDGLPSQVFSRRLESPEATQLALPPADVLSVSPTGELAVSLDRHFKEWFITEGQLARMALAGGAPRIVQTSVECADWVGDTDDLVVSRDTGDEFRLETSSGELLYRTSGWVSHVRVSPRKDAVAFGDHPFRGADNGSIAIVSLAGAHAKQTLSGAMSSLQGLAWRADGGEIWFSGAESGWNSALYAVTPAGRQRLVTRVPGRLKLHDIDAGGRVLLTEEAVRVSTWYGRMETGVDRDLSVFDSSIGMSLSTDGTLCVVNEQGEATSGGPYVSYLRKVDGSPAIRLGEGFLGALSPDGRWVATLAMGSAAAIHVLPTGAGQPLTLALGAIVPLCVAWFPDGVNLLIAGADAQGILHLYRQPLAGGDPTPVGPAGYGSPLYGQTASPDGRWVATVGTGRYAALCPTDGGTPRRIEGLAPGTIPLRFSSDGKTLFCATPHSNAAEIHRVELTSGRIETVRRLHARDPIGAFFFTPSDVTPDGEHYIYIAARITSQLFLVEGLR